MQAFRNAAKPVVILITVSFLVWMVVDLSGITGSSSGFMTRTSVGSINGEAVDSRAYQEAVQQTITQRQGQSGADIGIEETEAIRNEVWEGFIQQVALRSEIAKHKLTVTTDEVAQAIATVPPPEVREEEQFLTEGRFDMSKYTRWLGSPVGQQYVPVLEARYRDEILRAKLLRNVTADVFLSDPALWERYRDQNEKVSILLTPILPRTVVPDSAVSVSAAEVEEHYKSHKDDFARPKTAYMSFVAVPRMIDASDSAAALARARAVRAEIIGGAPFPEVARRESIDGSAAQGGELGTQARGATVAEFDQALFSIPIGQLSEPVLTQFGYHLLEVSKRTGDSATARHILMPIELAGAHRDLVDAQADSLDRLGADRLDPSALDTAARALRVPVGQTGPVQQGSKVQLGTYVIPDAAVWAFQAKKGETSPVIEGERGLYVFRLDSLHAAGTPPLTDIRSAVESEVRDLKKKERARAIGADLLRRVQAGATLPDASRAMGLLNRDFVDFTRVSPPLPNPSLVGAAFGLRVGQRSGLLDTPDGFYVIEVTGRVPADSAAFLREKDQIRADAIQAARQERVREYLAALRDGAKVKDERAQVLLTNAQAERNAPRN
ncbi:MAG: peptidyl-prolyl cis-trans isomerase [Gemmatimonadales bacterium]|nr:peptidyl-prolyl cis-trans isomerase [Gemmatimonadales bacterium]